MPMDSARMKSAWPIQRAAAHSAISVASVTATDPTSAGKAAAAMAEMQSADVSADKSAVKVTRAKEGTLAEAMGAPAPIKGVAAMGISAAGDTAIETSMQAAGSVSDLIIGIRATSVAEAISIKAGSSVLATRGVIPKGVTADILDDAMSAINALAATAGKAIIEEKGDPTMGRRMELATIEDAVVSKMVATAGAVTSEAQVIGATAINVRAATRGVEISAEGVMDATLAINLVAGIRVAATAIVGISAMQAIGVANKELALVATKLATSSGDLRASAMIGMLGISAAEHDRHKGRRAMISRAAAIACPKRRFAERLPMGVRTAGLDQLFI